jgi:ParB family transcriptional regulator, chromosome partitioning protein
VHSRGDDQKEQLETMLLENMQRSDLTVYEQSQGFQMMLDLGGSVDEICSKTGLSETTVRRRLKLTELNQKTLKKVSARQISFTDFDKLAKIEDIQKRNECLKSIGTNNFESSVMWEIKKQTAAKNTPIFLALMEKINAQQVTDGASWSGQYKSVGNYVSLSTWDGKESIVPEVDGQLYYFLTHDASPASVMFYTENKEYNRSTSKTEEDAQKKQRDEAWEYADELAGIAYDLRRNFVYSRSVSAKDIPILLTGAICADCFREISFYSADRLAYQDILGIKENEIDKIMDKFNELTAIHYLRLIYANFGDSKKSNYWEGYRERVFPRHCTNARLDALYKWLVCLGYEMSDEEKALQDGTHELFSCEKESTP